MLSVLYRTGSTTDQLEKLVPKTSNSTGYSENASNLLGSTVRGDSLKSGSVDISCTSL